MRAKLLKRVFFDGILRNYEIHSFIQGICSCFENVKCKIKEALDFQGPS